ncbi:MAG: hypothetical protein AAF564_26635 [Bacteroidota bacterium]
MLSKEPLLSQGGSFVIYANLPAPVPTRRPGLDPKPDLVGIIRGITRQDAFPDPSGSQDELC